jgi:hypothetical protein
MLREEICLKVEFDLLAANELLVCWLALLMTSLAANVKAPTLRWFLAGFFQKINPLIGEAEVRGVF